MEQWQIAGLKWAACGVVGYGLYRFYKKDKKDSKTARPQRATETRTEAPVRPERARRREEKRKTPGNPAEKPAGDESKEVVFTPHDGKHEQEVSNREFAQQYTNVRKGANLASSKRLESRTKSVKQSNANKTPELSATSSTTGMDADDDLSPALSPMLGAANGKPQSSGAGVSDMLEAPAVGPSVLRLTESTKPVRPSQPKKPSSSQATETKKQRQNKMKAEEAKMQREAEEKVRRELMEKQLRIARLASGETRNTGVTSQTGARSAWNGVKSTPAPAKASDEPSPLLDTMETNGVSNNSSDATPSPVSASTSATNWDHDLPSEEEQMRRLRDDDESSWITVPKGKKGNKKQNEADLVNGNERSNVQENGKATRDSD